MPKRVLQLLANRANYSNKLTIADCVNFNGRLHYWDYLYVPNCQVLQFRFYHLYYNSPHASYLIIDNTYKLLHRNHYWSNMQCFVKKYICHCNTCKRSKSFRFKKYDIFWPLLVSDQKWQDIYTDFVIGITAIKDINDICNIVDRLFKKCHLIAVDKKIDTKRLANLFVYHFWELYDLPQFIRLDYGTRFVNNFWKFLCKRLGMNVQFPNA